MKNTIEDIQKALEEHKVVLYKEKTGVIFMLNPFGGGVSSTGEFALRDDFEINEDNISRMVVVDMDNLN